MLADCFSCCCLALVQPNGLSVADLRVALAEPVLVTSDGVEMLWCRAEELQALTALHARGPHAPVFGRATWPLRRSLVGVEVTGPAGFGVAFIGDFAGGQHRFQAIKACAGGSPGTRNALA